MNALPSAAIAATATPAWHGCIFNGEWVPGHGGALPIYEPATGGLLHEVSKADLADLADVAAAVAQAKHAQRAWAATAPRERAAVFHRAAQVMQARSAEAALLIARETGGILPKAQREVDEAVAFYQHAAGLPLQAMGQVLPTGAGQLSLARHMPLGVVAVISPFNFPLILSLRSVGPALAMGNAVILKPDPRTPYTGGVIIAQVLEEAGLPKGLLHGDAQIGQALVEAPDIPMIAFTGSTAAGRRIGEIAGRHLKKVALELGGNNAVIVLDDADLDRAASAIAFGAYMHQGQICMATGRVLVQRSVADALTKRLAEKARHLPVGDPVSGTVALGPIIDQRQLQRVIDIVTDSVAAGAVVEAGATNEGLFYAATVLSNVRPGMRVFDEEVFGPVINVSVFDTDEEAAQMANHGEYGLAAGIMSASASRALGERLHPGLLHINDQTVLDEVINPFGGTGASGNGTSVGGPADWEQYTHWQWLTIKNEVPQYPF